MQPSLFNLESFAVAPASPIWERRGGGGVLGHKGAVHVHLPSGMQVHHCGHPTANFPYYIINPQGERILAQNGRGFQRLSLAKQQVEELWQDSK